MIGHDGFDHFSDDDFNYDDDDLPLDLRIAPEPGQIGLVGQAAILEVGEAISASNINRFVTEPKQAEQLDLPPAVSDPPAAAEEPADLLWTPIARLIMSPTRYREEWLRHISDMNYERHEHLKRNDPWGARWAVIRAHLYSLPVSWLLIPSRLIFNLLRHWLGF